MGCPGGRPGKAASEQGLHHGGRLTGEVQPHQPAGAAQLCLTWRWVSGSQHGRRELINGIKDCARKLSSPQEPALKGLGDDQGVAQAARRADARAAPRPAAPSRPAQRGRRADGGSCPGASDDARASNWHPEAGDGESADPGWAGQTVRRASTSSAMARLLVRPGDSMPSRCTRPATPWSAGPRIMKSAAGSCGPLILGRMPA